MPDTLRADIVGLLADGMGLSVPSDDTDLFEAGILDSMGLVELLIQIESTFGLSVNLGDVEIENFRSVETITDFVAGARMSS